MICFRLLFARPLDWARGTDLNTHFNDTNQVIIKVAIEDEADKEVYNVLVRWIKRNVAIRGVKLSLHQSHLLWDEMTRYYSTIYLFHNLSICHRAAEVIYLTDDEEGDETSNPKDM